MEKGYSILKEVILGRRSIRRFLPDDIPEEDLMEMLECARWAPSDTNQQPWRFIVITNKEKIKELEHLCLREIERLQEKAVVEGYPEVARKLKVFGKYAVAFSGAPAVIILAGEPYRSRFTEEIFTPVFPAEHVETINKEESIKSVSLAAQNLLLAAHALGYGACAMTGPVILAERDIAALAGLREEEFVVMVIAVGRPAQQPEGPGRSPLSEKAVWIR